MHFLVAVLKNLSAPCGAWNEYGHSFDVCFILSVFTGLNISSIKLVDIKSSTSDGLTSYQVTDFILLSLLTLNFHISPHISDIYPLHWFTCTYLLQPPMEKRCKRHYVPDEDWSAKVSVSVGHLKDKEKMSRVMRKPAFCICENKGADQL